MKYLLVLFFILFFMNCSRETPTQPSEDRLVVQAYVFAGKPPRDIYLAKALPFRKGLHRQMPSVHNAVVSLKRNDVTYTLIPTLDERGNFDGHYHYPGSDFLPNVGDTLKLEIQYNGQTVTAQTTVPPPVENITVPFDTIKIEQEEGAEDSDPVLIHWDAPDQDFVYYYTLASIDSNAVAVNSSSQARRSSADIVLDPMLKIWPHWQINYYGHYRVIVYTVRKEFAVLKELGLQDNRNLHGFPGNIKNGLGLFAAFTGDSTFFYVEKK